MDNADPEEVDVEIFDEVPDNDPFETAGNHSVGGVQDDEDHS